jgi:hypothetical protein
VSCVQLYNQCNEFKFWDGMAFFIIVLNFCQGTFGCDFIMYGLFDGDVNDSVCIVSNDRMVNE